MTVFPSDNELWKKIKHLWELNFSVYRYSVFKCEVGQRAEWGRLGCCVGKFLDTWVFGFFRKCLRDLVFLCVVTLRIALNLGKEMGGYYLQPSEGIRVCPLWKDFNIPALLHLHPKETGLWQVTQGSRGNSQGKTSTQKVIKVFRQNKVMLN